VRQETKKNGTCSFERSLPEQACTGGLSASNLFAEAFEISLGNRRQTLSCQLARPGGVDDVFKRARQEQLPDPRVLGCSARHLVQDGETAVDLTPRRALLLDGAGEVCPEAGIQKIIIVADLKACLGKKIGKIPAQVVTDLL
jgi:hypothetical protein